MVRYFGQSPEYWLDNCTLPDWRDIWRRELIEQPPAETFLADYFGYKPPVTGEVVDEVVDLGLPEFEE